MVDLDIIALIEKPIDWVNSLVVVEKLNGKLRMCLDPRPLNNAIKRKYIQLPTVDEIFSQMSGACFFSKLDASMGYWQIKVDEKSSHLLAFGTPLGRYHFKCYLTEFIQPAKFSDEKLSSLFQISPLVLTPNMI